MEEKRRQLLEARLQSILGELGEVCSELGISLQPGVATSTPAPPPPETVEEVGPILLCKLQDHLVAFTAANVEELVRMVELTPSVEPRPEVEGFVNVRGVAIVVLNLAHLLAREDQDHDPDQVLVLLQSGHGQVALVVDEVLDIYEAEVKRYQGRHQLELTKGFLKGVAQIEDSLVAVLDPDLLAGQVL